MKIYTYTENTRTPGTVCTKWANSATDLVHLWGEGTEAELIEKARAAIFMVDSTAEARIEAVNVLNHIDHLTESPKPNAIDTTAEMIRRENEAAAEGLFITDKMALANIMLDDMTKG